MTTDWNHDPAPYRHTCKNCNNYFESQRSVDICHCGKTSVATNHVDWEFDEHGNPIPLSKRTKKD